MSEDRLITLGIDAMCALARLDVAAHGYVTPRVHFVRGGAVEPLEWSPGAALALALENVPTDRRAEMAKLHHREQLTGGRARIAALLEHAGAIELPPAALMLMTYTDTLPESVRLRGVETGGWIEVWRARERRIVRRGVMPLVPGASAHLTQLQPVPGETDNPTIN